MSLIFSFLKNPVVLITFVLLLATVVIFSMIAFPSPKPQQPRPNPVIQTTITPTPYFDTNKTPTPQRTDYLLSPIEKNYPEITPQPFSSQSSLKGSLVITSIPSEARVVIDVPEEEASSNNIKIPVNTTPLKVTDIPTGKYTLFAFKEGYTIYTSAFTIEKDKVTRLEIKLNPEEVVVGY